MSEKRLVDQHLRSRQRLSGQMDTGHWPVFTEKRGRCRKPGCSSVPKVQQVQCPSVLHSEQQLLCGISPVTLCVCVCVCVRARARARVRACVRACV